MCDAWMVCSWMSKTEDEDGGGELEAILCVCECVRMCVPRKML